MTFSKHKSTCPLCSSKNIAYKYSVNHKSYNFAIYICNDCFFQFMNPCYDKDSIEKFYTEGYYNGISGFSYVDERLSENFSNYVWDARLKTIRRFSATGNFLDVGCSFGGFLKRASKYFTPFGIELSKYSSVHAKEFFGSNIWNGTLDDHPFDYNFFSVITMIELIEHIEYPVVTLQECYNLLKPGGLLVIQTANFDGWQAENEGLRYHYYLPGHLSYFNETNLSGSLMMIGFRMVMPFFPTDFGVIPKLLKSRGSFKNFFDYLKWMKIISYHFKSKIRICGKPLTSSMVIYAIK